MARHPIRADALLDAQLDESEALPAHARIRQGLPYELLESVMRRYRLDREETCATLDLSPRTFSRRRSQGKLRADESDRLYRLARIAQRASQVLGDSQKAAEWLHRQNRALGGCTPLQLLASDIGAREVERVLGRLEHGVAS